MVMIMRRAVSIFVILSLVLGGLSLTTFFDFDITTQNAAAFEKKSGTITVDDTWEYSPIFITGNVIINTGITVTITAGALVSFNGSYKITVSNGATLIADGGPGQEITFNNTASTKWDSIVVQDGGVAIFDWCIIDNSTNGIVLQNNNYNTDITNCSFTYCNKYLDLSGSRVNITSTKFNGSAFEANLATNNALLTLDGTSELFIRYFTMVFAVNGSSDLSARPNRIIYPIPDVNVQLSPNQTGQNAPVFLGKTDLNGVFSYSPLTSMKISGTTKSRDYTTFQPYNFTINDKYFNDPWRKNKGGRSINYSDINISNVAENSINIDDLFINSNLYIYKYFVFDYKPVINDTLPSKITVTEDLKATQDFDIFDNDDDDLQNNTFFNITDQNGISISDEFGPINNENRWIWYDYASKKLEFLRNIESPFAPQDDYDAIQDETITVNITDLLGHRTTISFVVEFHNVPDKPQVTGIETTIPYDVTEDVPLYIDIDVSDNDNATSDIDLITDPAFEYAQNVTYEYIDSSNQRLKLVFPNEFGDDGTIKQINITATDNCWYESAKNEVPYSFTVKFSQTADAPKINGTIPNKIGNETDWIPELSLKDYWYDEDPDDKSITLKWYVTGLDSTYFEVTGQNSTANSPLSFNWDYPGDLGGAQNPNTITDTVNIWLWDQYGLQTHQSIDLIVHSTNKQPSLHKVDIGGTSKVTVQPESGDNEVYYRFMVEYKDEDGATGDPPEYVKVVIDNLSYDMIEDNEEDDDYSDGKVYYYDIKLEPGIHEHYFLCSDSDITTRLPTIDKDPNIIFGPVVITKIYTGTYKSIDENFIAKITYSGADGTATISTPNKPTASHGENMGDIEAYFQIDTLDMLTIESMEVTVKFGDGYTNYESRWLRKTDMELAYLDGTDWKSFMYSTNDETNNKLTCQIAKEYGHQTILTKFLSNNDKPTLTVIGTLDADNDVLWGGRYNANDDFPFDLAASEDTDGDGSPNRWNPGKGQSDSTSSPRLHLDAFPNDPAASVDTDGDKCPDDWNPGKFQNDSTSNPPLVRDLWPNDPGVCADTDGDNNPDSIDYAKLIDQNLREDTDDDNDGMADHWEINQTERAIRKGLKWRFDPKDPSDGAEDWDGDGWNNTREYAEDSDPFKKDSTKEEDDILGGSNLFMIIIIIIIIIVVVLVLVFVMKSKGKKEEEPEPDAQPQTPPPGEVPPPPTEGGEGEMPPPMPMPEGVGEGEVMDQEQLLPEQGVEGEGMGFGAEEGIEPPAEETMAGAEPAPGLEGEAEAELPVATEPEPTSETAPSTLEQEQAVPPTPDDAAGGATGTAPPETPQFTCPICNTVVTSDMANCPGCQTPLSF